MMMINDDVCDDADYDDGDDDDDFTQCNPCFDKTDDSHSFTSKAIEVAPSSVAHVKLLIVVNGV